MKGGIYQRILLMFSPGHEIKSPFFISLRKFLGDGLKQQPWIYCINSVLVLSLVTVAWDLWRVGLSIVIYYNPDW